MAAENFFTWGDNGSKLTPEQIAIAKQLLARKRLQGADTSPVQHWTQGAARVADALGDVIQEKRLNSQESENNAYNSSLISSLLGSSGAPATIPSPAAAGELGKSSPVPSSPVQPGGIPEVADYIKQGAIARGMDPNIVLRVAGHEGLNVFDPSKPDGGGDEGSSFGPFQLHYAGRSKSMPNPGLGDEFTKATGLHASDPSTWKQQVDFSLDWARKHGWSPWMGAKAEGITGMMGIGNAPSQQASQVTSPIVAVPSMPGEVASLDPSIGIPMPGAAGQMRATAPSQPLPPQTGSSPVASVPPVNAIPAEFQNSAQLMNADPNKGILQPILGGGTPASPQQVAQAASAAPPVAPPQGIGNGALVRALTSPQASEGTRRIASILLQQRQAQQQAFLEQQLKQSDPAYLADLKLKQLQADQLAHPRISPTDEANIGLNRDKFKFEQDQAALTPDIKEYKFAKDNGYTGSFAQYQIDLKKSAANNTTINTGEGNKFYNTLDEKNAGIFSGLSDTGIQARSTLGQIDALDNLLKASPTGWVGAMKQTAGEYGINTEGLSDIQAATALINKMVPTQRQPGSGTMSDADLALFKQSLPRIINQPGGNQTIINTIRGISQYQVQMGGIADRVANRELTPAEGRAAIAALPNPLSNFKAPPPGKEEEGWTAVPTDVPGVTIRRKN